MAVLQRRRGENDVHPGGQMLFLSLGRRAMLLLSLFITLKQDPWWAFTVPRFHPGSACFHARSCTNVCRSFGGKCKPVKSHDIRCEYMECEEEVIHNRPHSAFSLNPYNTLLHQSFSSHGSSDSNAQLCE